MDLRQAALLSGPLAHAKFARMSNRAPTRLVVFDCDGTLVDSQHLIVDAMTSAFIGMGLPAPGAAAIRRIVGLSLFEAADALLGEESSRATAERLVAGYREAFTELRRQPHEEPLFPGVREVLARLEARGCLMAVATGKSLRGLQTTLGRHGLAGHFVSLQTADYNAGKPNPEMVERAMADAGLGREETMVVGDTSFDIHMARNAGVLAVGVAWGYHESTELMAAGAETVLEHFDELDPLLDGRGAGGA
jgi:phosphoglycolate phosphatase